MRRIIAVAALALVAVSATASAQARRGSMSNENPSPEIGIDAGLTFSTGSPSVTQFDFPARLVRIGFFISPEISIEPALSLHTASGGGFSATDYELGVGALYHFQTSRAANQVYVRPFVNLLGSSATGATSSSDVLFGAGVGVKMPLRSQLATRFEANIGHINNSNLIGLLAGLSFYTR